jgi:hypothetical protein
LTEPAHTLSKTNPGPTASQKAVRHFIAEALVFISATRSLVPNELIEKSGKLEKK